MPNPANATVMLVARDLAARDALIEKLERMPGIPGASLHVRRLSLGPSLGSPVQYRVTGPDPARLRAIAQRIAAVLRAIPSSTAVQINWGIAAPVARFRIDPARAAALGWTGRRWRAICRHLSARRAARCCVGRSGSASWCAVGPRIGTTWAV